MSLILSPSSSIYSPYNPLIVTSEAIVSPEVILSSISPLYPLTKPITLSFEYSKPLIGVYETIDTNPEVRSKMVSYYYDLIRDKWLLDELNDVLNYFIHRDGKISMIKSASDYNPANIAKDTDKIAEEKVEYIEKNLFSKKNLAKFISKFTRETDTKWVDLPKNEFLLRTALKEYLLRLIRKELKGQKGGNDDFDFDQLFTGLRGGNCNGSANCSCGDDHAKFEFEKLFV